MMRRFSRCCSSPATNTAIVHKRHSFYIRIYSLSFRYILAAPITSPCRSPSPVSSIPLQQIHHHSPRSLSLPLLHGAGQLTLSIARCSSLLFTPPYATYNLYIHTYTSRALDCRVSSQFHQRCGTYSFGIELFVWYHD